MARVIHTGERTGTAAVEKTRQRQERGKVLIVGLAQLPNRVVESFRTGKCPEREEPLTLLERTQTIRRSWTVTEEAGGVVC